MALLTDSERKLLERLATEGKATRLALSELEAAKSLEADGFVFLVGANAIITPKEVTAARQGGEETQARHTDLPGLHSVRPDV